MLSANALGKFIAIAFASLAATTFVTAAESKPAASPGKIVVLKSEGKTSAINTTDGSVLALKPGLTLAQGYRIETGAASTVILLFSNGSTITVNPNSVFSIDRFLQDPFDAQSVDYKAIEREPSGSTTRVNLTKGSVVGNMRKLNKGSKWDFATPAGVAGIRGTIIKVTTTTITIDGKTYSVMNVSVPDGSAAVTGTDINGNPVSFDIAQGKQATFVTDANGNFVPMTAAMIAAITGIAGTPNLASATLTGENGASTTLTYAAIGDAVDGPIIVAAAVGSFGLIPAGPVQAFSQDVPPGTPTNLETPGNNPSNPPVITPPVAPAAPNTNQPSPTPSTPTPTPTPTPTTPTPTPTPGPTPVSP